MDSKYVIVLKKTLQEMHAKDMIDRELIKNILILYGHSMYNEWEMNVLYDVVIGNVNTLALLLVNIKTLNINIKQLCCMIWLEFIHDDNIDKISILKLRAKCSQLQKKQNMQFPGETLLRYTTTNILNNIPEDIKHIKWQQYIDDYISINFTKPENLRILQAAKISESQRKQVLMDIMDKYNKIINVMHDDDKKADALEALFNCINMSQLMDAMFDIKRRNIRDSEQIKAYQCQLKTECKIFKNNIESHRHRSMPRVLKVTQQYQKFNQMTSEMELLDLIHVRLFHPNNRRRLVQMTDDIITPDLEFENNELFLDKINNNNLKSFQQFCENEQFDTDAMYYDMYPDNDTQSNIYYCFKNKLKNKINQYYALKENILTYTINPPKKNDKDLIELDFGEHVIDWNVEPKFCNVKQEWMGNEFCSIEQYIYDSLYSKSETIAATHQNKSTYNLLTDDILCIKTYTDTTELQRNFRHAFRSSSDDNRRAQFFHWATNINIIFIKIAIGNALYERNQFICNVTLYHGLDRLFDTKKLVRQFHGALSTTWDKQSAKNFAGDDGMILQINKEINNKNLNAIEVDWISCHDSEQEVLLLNPEVLIQKSTIFSKDVALKSAYLKRILLSTINQGD
eukprot:450736_1